MIRLLAFLVLVSLALPDAYAADCATFRDQNGNNHNGCLPISSEVTAWNQIAANVSSLSNQITTQQALISALQNQVNAIPGGTTPGTGVFPDLFDMTPAQGSQVGGAVLGLLALAFVFRMLIKTLNDG